jgi:hypothetical protein
MTQCGCNKTPCGCGATGVAIGTAGLTIATTGLGTARCGCRGRGCAACEPRAFIRPRFFAGQLLTDEDLALLGDYVVAKNRFHNRALWGPGVVCGLDVNCDPCGDGHVIVQPGYAITCCGDDIVVPCPESVDILALIRELMKSTLGAECADPCEQPRPQRPPTPPAPPAPPTAPPAGGPPSPGISTVGIAPVPPNPQAPVRRYYLYIRYVEDLTDPVSPYATDEPCAGQACEPTRVREGHRYELRCENDNPHFLGLGDRLLQCIGDLKQAQASAGDAAVIGRIGLRLQTAQRALAQTPSPVFVAADVDALRTATAALRDALAALAPKPPATGGEPAPGAVDPDAVRRAIEALRVAASLFARLVMTPVKQRPEADPGAIAEAQRTIGEARKALSAAIPKANLSTTEAAEAQATLDLVEQFPRVTDPPPTISYAQRLWALGAPVNDALVNEVRAGQGRLLSYIGPRLLAGPRRSDCQLLAQFEGIRPIGETSVTEAGMATLAQLSTLSSQVLGRLLFECLCDAFNPPCQGCDDQAVLLAEICVQDCVVIDICEMVRRFVITWPSVRYWTGVPNFPFGLDAIGQRIEQICCMLRGRLGSGCPPDVGLTTGVGTLTGAPVVSLLRTATRAAADEPLAQLGDLLAVIEPLATASAVVPGGARPPLDPAVERIIQTRVNDAVSAALASTERELAALRAEIAQLTKRRKG